jgi:DNA-binding NarL/FixJ family response regulator
MSLQPGGARMSIVGKSGSRRSEPRVVTVRLAIRELDVLKLIAEGLGNREVGRRLFVSDNTVKNHVRNILEKLHLHTRIDAVMYAVRENLFDVPDGNPLTYRR